MPYNPDEKTRKIFRQAAIDAYHYMLEGYGAGLPAEMMWPNRSWRDVFYTDPDGGFSWDTEGMLDYDNRARPGGRVRSSWRSKPKKFGAAVWAAPGQTSPPEERK